MGITGARWGLSVAEAVLKMRAVRTSGDWDDYWCFHLEKEHAATTPTRRPHDEPLKKSRTPCSFMTVSDWLRGVWSTFAAELGAWRAPRRVADLTLHAPVRIRRRVWHGIAAGITVETSVHAKRIVQQRSVSRAVGRRFGCPVTHHRGCIVRCARGGKFSLATSKTEEQQPPTHEC